MAKDSPDYIKPVSVEAGEVIINPGSSPIPITPSSGSTFNISGPVTVQSSETTLQVDTSATPSFGADYLYYASNITLYDAGINLGTFDVSKFASVIFYGYSRTSHWSLEINFLPPSPANIEVWGELVYVRAGDFFQWWIPVAAPRLSLDLVGVNEGNLNLLVVYGSTVPAPAFSTTRYPTLLSDAVKTVSVNTTAYWSFCFSPGGHQLTIRGNAGQSSQVILQERSYSDVVINTLLDWTGTLGYLSQQIALGTLMYTLAVTNKGTSSNTISVSVYPL